MLACGIGFFLWGDALRNRAGRPFEIQKAKKHKASIDIEPMDESKTGLSKTSTSRVKLRKDLLGNSGNYTEKVIGKGLYVSESEINDLTLKPYEIGEVASLLAKLSLTTADLGLTLEHAILYSRIGERNIGERISLSPVDLPFPSRKGNLHISRFGQLSYPDGQWFSVYMGFARKS